MFLPGESHGESSLAGYSPWGLQRVGHDRATNPHIPCAIGCSGSLRISVLVLRIILLSSFYKFELQAERVTSLLKTSQLQNDHSWVPETDFLIPRLIFFCSTPSSLLKGYFTLPLKKPPCNYSLWGPVLTKAILFSFCPPLLGPQQTAVLCPRVPSLHTAHSQFFPFSLLGPSLWIHCSLSEFLCVWSLGLISRQNSRNFPIAFPFVPILQSWEKQLFLQWLRLLFFCWLTILWVKSEV